MPVEVHLPAPVLKYQDELPLSDIVVAANGAVCCARRIPELAEVLVWPEGLAGTPESWTGPPRLPILRIFAFDGSVAYAFTDRQLLRVRPGAVDTLHTTSRPIRSAHLSPDGRHVVWIENARIGRGYVAPVEPTPRPRPLRISDDCFDVRWASATEIVALELHHSGDVETGQSMHLVGLGGDVLSTVLATEDDILQLGPVSTVSRRAIVFGHARHARRPRAGAWALELQTGASRCLAGASPAGGSAALLSDGCVFADAARQTSASSRLIFAAEAGCRAADVAAFLREFALAADGRSILCRVFGTPFGIAELPIDALRQDVGAG
ncbi:MAG TPA: hypothetical protein VFW70_14195 [Methylomirabilota bacterium]|nr:hypothetical protein [Methylomirabilota bacterium]